jgi:chromosome segregation ATPase
MTIGFAWVKLDGHLKSPTEEGHMLTFIRNLVGVKADRTLQAGVEALVRWDPEAASEAELRTMEQHLDDLGRQVATARQSFDREQREAEAIEGLSRQRMAAAEQLQSQMAAETDPTRKAALERSLATLVTMLEEMAPELEREKQDAVDAREFLDMLEQTYADAGGKMKTARSELDRARRDMARAGQQRQTAEHQAEAARRAAGLTQATSSVTVALKAMQEAAQRDLVSADAAIAKAKLLRPTRPEQDDPNIAAAMAAAAGKPTTPQSVTDRLAALKARGGR